MNQDMMLKGMDLGKEYTVLELASMLFGKMVEYKDKEHLAIYHKIKPLYIAGFIKKSYRILNKKQVLYIKRVKV